MTQEIRKFVHEMQRPTFWQFFHAWKKGKMPSPYAVNQNNKNSQ